MAQDVPGRIVVIVDDQEREHEVPAEILQQLGFGVAKAMNLAQARQLLKADHMGAIVGMLVDGIIENTDTLEESIALTTGFVLQTRRAYPGITLVAKSSRNDYNQRLIIAGCVDSLPIRDPDGIRAVLQRTFAA